MTTVLCTNGLLSKTLAVVRSTGRRGIRTIVGEKTSQHTSGYSKYAAKTVVYPDPARDPERFFDWLCDTIVREQVDFLFPMDDDVMEVIVPRQDELKKLCRVPVPKLENYRIAADKSLTMRLAEKRNVPHPRTAETAFGPVVGREELLALAAGMDYPLCLKPRTGSGSRGVRFANDADELVELFREVHASYPNPLIQEAVSYGGKFGVCLCYDANHRLRASFIHKELRNYPEERGPSTLRESVKYDELLEHSVRLMDGLSWHGVALVEYMIDSRTGKPKLMEINPRYWTSLHLAISCGIDFPWLQYQLAMGTDPEPVHEYPAGVLGRQLFLGDTLYFLTNKNRWRMDPPYFTTQIQDDILSREDKWPTVGFLVSALRYSLSLKMWKFIITR